MDKKSLLKAGREGALPALRRAVSGLLVLWFSLLPGVGAAADDEGWYRIDAAGEVSVRLYFFWSSACPHCNEARPVVEALAAQHPWIELASYELLSSSANRERYRLMAAALGEEARSVPAFLYCDRMSVGFDASGESARALLQGLSECRDHLQREGSMPPPESTLPAGLGIDYRDYSLFTLTILIGALDAFNPCAFFVLLFLLSLLVNSRSRARMLLIGGIFVFVSGALYFLFMAAWLNLFLLAGMQRLFTLAAGGVALGMALINIKDFFWPGRGPSLSISDERKPGLFQRMRALLQAERLPTLVLATVTLAVAANSYELLCTSGLPMIYTRILTLEALPTLHYYLYLLLYNVVYVVPLLLIVLAFTFTLGRHKLQPQEGRLLKLLSGVMMLELALVLLLAPQLLSSLRLLAGGLLGAVLLALAGWYWLRLRAR